MAVYGIWKCDNPIAVVGCMTPDVEVSIVILVLNGMNGATNPTLSTCPSTCPSTSTAKPSPSSSTSSIISTSCTDVRADTRLMALTSIERLRPTIDDRRCLRLLVNCSLEPPLPPPLVCILCNDPGVLQPLKLKCICILVDVGVDSNVDVELDTDGDWKCESDIDIFPNGEL